MTDGTDVPSTVEEFRANLAAVRARIDAAAIAAGREPSEVRLLAVSKTVAEDRLANAVAAGAHYLGENKVQEAERKARALAHLDVRWAVIGHLQTNKAKDVAVFAHEFQALDSLKLAEALDRRLTALGRSLDVYVQVNTSGEESKFGLNPDEVDAFIAQLPQYPSLRVVGLMTLAANTADTGAVRRCFVTLRTLRDRLRASAPNGELIIELSMGMSGDFELAVAEGSTVVRVGQAIFGAR
ncbi:MAG: YggS family pyridoxal phosphate-dependent enzyme [Actinobacteria bacterium]|nr:YggS family pyridoxal phosphate-dependent enzyme [Actinomycetota bacterium]